MTLKERLRERAKRLPAWFHFVVNAGAIGLGVLWWVTYSGPYRWFAERQLAWSNEYDVKFTGLMVLFACLLTGVAITQIAASFVPERSDPGAAALHARMDAFGTFLTRNTYLLAMTGVVVALALVGGFMMIQARLSGGFVTVAAEALERGHAPEGVFARVEGRQLWDRTVSFTKTGSDSGTKTIVPIVSTGWQPGQPVALFVRMDDYVLRRLSSDARENGTPPALSGLLSAGDLDGIARTELEGKAMVIADRHYVLDQGETPERREGLGKILLGVSGVASPIVLVVWLVKRRRRNAG
jgi:hypothetical protein